VVASPRNQILKGVPTFGDPFEFCGGCGFESGRGPASVMAAQPGQTFLQILAPQPHFKSALRGAFVSRRHTVLERGSLAMLCLRFSYEKRQDCWINDPARP
jgi:hypothetical protein